MVRRYEEPIEVRADVGAVDVGVAGAGGVDHDDRDGDIGCVPDPTPSAFLWRGRLYIVRDVIGHWRERRAWWRDALDPDEEVAARGLDCLEQEVWRVEASPGRLAGTGVYDLGMHDLGMHDLGLHGLGTAGPARSWRLLRVAD